MGTTHITVLLQSAAAAIAAGRLIHLGLARRFPALLAWLLLVAAGNLLSIFPPYQSALYFWFYFVGVPLECAAAIFAVRELFALVFIDYPGIRSVGRWAIYAGIAIATSASILIANIFPRSSPHGSHHLFYFEVAQRSVVFSLAVAILTILFVLSTYPLHLSRNTYVCSTLFSLCFLTDAVRLLIDSLKPLLIDNYIDWAEAVILAGCLVTWGLLLQPASAARPPDPNLPTGHEEYLLEQLASLNQILGRVAR